MTTTFPANYPTLQQGEAEAIVAASFSPRYAELHTLQSYYECTQYDGRGDWFADSDRPLKERKPCVVLPTARNANHSHTSFALPEGKFPQITALISEDNSAMGGLNEADSAKLDAFNASTIQISRLESAGIVAMKMGQASRSVATVISLRKGVPAFESLWAKICTPEFNPQDPDEVTALEVTYRYIEMAWEAKTGKWWPIVYQYRRRIDAVSDTTYQPLAIQSLQQQVTQPTVPDPSRTATHGFGFCPVVWWKSLATSDVGTGFDGHALHEKCLSQIEGIDMTLSQRQRAVFYQGDPQWFLSGIDPNAPLAPSGRTAIPIDPSNPTGDPRKAGPWAGALYGTSGGKTQATTKKGPGVVWSTESTEAKAQLITLPGDATVALSTHAEDLLTKCAESMSWVRIDPTALRGTADLSAKAMVIMYAKQLAYVARLRGDFGTKWILPVLSMLYRIFLATPVGLYVPGIDKVRGILQRMQVTLSDQTTLWLAPNLKLVWPDAFEPSDNDELTRVTVAQMALDAGVITTASAVEHIKPVFNIGDPVKYLDDLQKEKAQRQADAVANAQALTAAAPPPPAPKAGTAPPTAKPAAPAPKASGGMQPKK